jgi:uncharacterized repeat protein (TIGR03806 family)
MTLQACFATSLLGALLACTGAPIAPANSSNLPIDSVGVGTVASGLSERPGNPRCVAGHAAQVPQQLSQLGCFDAADVSKPGPGLVPYDVNAPLWSDDADKQRWFAIPDSEHIRIDDAGHFVLPKGSVLLKTFSRAGQRLETRVWMNHPDAGWLGYSYRWAVDGSDASLAADAGELISNGNTVEPWTIPGRGQCSQCHQPGQSQILGLQVAQLDRDFVYPSTGRSANQLGTLAAVGLLAPGTRIGDAHAKLVDYRDASQPLEPRARSYLHANCSSCHASAVGYCTGDFRIETSAAQMGICDVAPSASNPSWGWLSGTKLLAPGDPERSALWLRLSAPGNAAMAMPPLGRHQVHEQGVELIAAWISALPGCER